MTRIGGTDGIIAAVKAAGGQPGPMSVWVTGGALKWGTANIDAHYAKCKAAGVTPLILFWFWGDDISTAAIQNGVQDRYQGTWKTRAAALTLARTIGEKAQAAGVAPIIAIEHEFAQQGLETDGSAFAPYFRDASAAIKAACPAARIAFCCPIWEDEAVIAKTYGALIAGADIVASQTLLFPPRHGAKEFTNAGLNFTDAFTKLRVLAPGKPTCIIDLGFSSYGGPYQAAHPFAGGTGNGNDALQAAAIKSVADVAPGLGLEFIIYRGLTDAANFDVKNYGGYAERHVGLTRVDGTRKPAFEVVMQMSRATTTVPGPTLESRTQELLVCRGEVDGLQTRLKAAEVLTGILQEKMALARTGIDAAGKALA